jgi:predicted DNA-binding ribbon-helix-helix protein
MRGGASSLHKHTIEIAGRETSVSLEDEFWRTVKIIASARMMPINELIGEIDAGRKTGTLASAVRVHCLQSRMRP